MDFLTLIKQVRQQTEKRNFEQTLDLIINLKDFDVRRESLNTSTEIPVLQEKRKICGFLENKSSLLDRVLTKEDIDKISPLEIKKLGKKYDFFVSSAKLMPLVASKFGKSLGAAGKMPDPKIGGVVMQETEENIKRTYDKLSKTVKLKAKEPSLKVAIGKESMSDEDLAKNADAIFKAVFNALPKREMNLRSVMLKFTMGKPLKTKTFS